jgi:hypothetical protein
MLQETWNIARGRVNNTYKGCLEIKQKPKNISGGRILYLFGEKKKIEIEVPKQTADITPIVK